MESDSTNRQTVESDENLFALTEAINEADGIGVTELADRVNLAKSSVHSHLATMRSHEFAVKRDGEYHLNLEFFRYGQYTRAKCDVYSAAWPVLDEIAAKTGETT